MVFWYSYIYIFIYYCIDMGIFYYFDYKLIFIRIFFTILHKQTLDWDYFYVWLKKCCDFYLWNVNKQTKNTNKVLKYEILEMYLIKIYVVQHVVDSLYNWLWFNCFRTGRILSPGYLAQYLFFPGQLVELTEFSWSQQYSW